MRVFRSIPETYETFAIFSILALCWGTSFVAIEIGLAYVPPLLFAGLRYAVAGLIVFAYAAVFCERLVPTGRDEWGAVAVAGAFLIALYHALLYVGELYVPGALAATIVSATPILTAALAGVLFPEERLSRVGVGGLAVGLAGVIVVVRPGAGTESDLYLGAALVFGAAVAFAVGSVLVRPLESTLPVEALQAWSMVLGAGILLGWALLRGESPAAIDPTPVAIASFGYLTLVSSVFAFLLFFELLERSGPTEVTLVAYAEPAVAMAVSALLLGYVVDSAAFVGLATILAGFLMLKLETVRRLVAGEVERHTWG